MTMTLQPQAVRLTLRPACERDVPAIQKVAREAWDATFSDLMGEAERRRMLEHLYPTHSLCEDLCHRGSSFLVAALGDAVVGFAELVQEGASAEVARVAVRPDWQRRGIASALLAHGLAELAAGGVQEVTAAVESTDEGCRRLFERRGFRAVEQEISEIDDLRVELVEYAREIREPDELATSSEATIWIEDGTTPRRSSERAPRFVTVLETDDPSRLAFAESVLDGAGIAFAIRGEVAEEGGEVGEGPSERGAEIRVAPSQEEEALGVLEALDEVEPALEDQGEA